MPSSELLKQLLDTRKKPSLLLGSVERYLLGRQNPRDTTVLHPSEIVRADWCLRASWYLLRGATRPATPPGLRLSSVFAEGHAIHDKWQGWLTGMDALIGVWLCESCEELWWGHRSDLHMDHRCRVSYQEVPVFDNVWIEGRADGWLDHTRLSDMSEDHLLEIKSVGTGTVRAYGGRLSPGGLEKTFSFISSPFPGHVRQVMLYLWLLHLMHANGKLDRQPPMKALVLYECKADQAVKEFSLDYDPEWLEGTLNKYQTFDPSTVIPPPCSSGKPHCPQCKGFA